MKSSFFVAFLLAAALLPCGCGKHCLSVDGDWKGVDGKIEYCFDSKASKEADAPVITTTEDETFFGISLEELEQIAGALTGDAENTKAATREAEHPLKEIRRHLKKKEAEAAGVGPAGEAAWLE